MYLVYKITCLSNGKIYVGQTTETLKQRFKRHLNYNGDTKFYRAIKKYGKENFKIELIDTANNQKELDEKEFYWIKKLNAVEKGYNSKNSMGKCGGDTLSHHPKLKEISKKLSQSKMGGKNPNSTAVVAINTITNETIKFDSMSECQKYFNLKNHNHIRRRCVGKTKVLFKKVWTFKYFESVETTENIT